MRVRIRKQNDGITIAVVTATGEPSKQPFGRATRYALNLVESWYRARVREGFVHYGMQESGYARQFRERVLSREVADRRGRGSSGDGLHMSLEPWGFAREGTDGQPTMADTGSTATGGRAKMLAAYQWPLYRTPDPEDPDCSLVERFVRVDLETGTVVPEPKPEPRIGSPHARARLDADGTAKPLTRIVHHPPAGACVGPGMSLHHPEYEAPSGTRTRLA